MLARNPFMQWHFVYFCISWYPLTNQKQKKELQAVQNKCISLYFSLVPITTNIIYSIYPQRNALNGQLMQIFELLEEVTT